MQREIVVAKFGGESSSTPERIAHSAALLKDMRSQDPATVNILVYSAIGSDNGSGKATDELLRSYGLALSGVDYKDPVLNLAERHEKIINTLVGSSRATELHERLQKGLDRTLSILGDMKKPTINLSVARDEVASQGEMWIAPIVSAFLDEEGMPTAYVDGVLVTNSEFGDASPQYTETLKRYKEKVAPLLHTGVNVVLRGYGGEDEEGRVATLGRGGSDEVAGFISFVARAREIVMYKQEAGGVHRANPQKFPRAGVIPALDYEEAATFAAFGAKVLHPRAIHHPARLGIPVFVRSTEDYLENGTRIDKHGNPDDAVKGTSIRPNDLLVEVEGWGMDRAGIADALTSSFNESSVNIVSTDQPVGSRKLRVLVEDTEYARAALEVAKETLREPIGSGDIDIFNTVPVATLGVIGKKVADPDIQAQVRGSMGDMPKPRFVRVDEPELAIFIERDGANFAEQAEAAIQNTFFPTS